MSPPPLSISVVVNNYNYDSYLRSALDSVITQLEPGDELIVVDDGSTDNSRKIIEDYAIRDTVNPVFQNNTGQIHAVFRGIESSVGDIIVLLDSDDLLLPGYLEQLRKIYTEKPDINFVFSRAEIIGDEAPRKREMAENLEAMRLPRGNTGRLKWSALLFSEYSGSPTSGLSLRRTLARELTELRELFYGSVKDSTFLSRFITSTAHRKHLTMVSADTAIVLLASVLGHDKFFHDQPGFQYRIHGANAYASLSLFGRWYYRRCRKLYLHGIFNELLQGDTTPTCVELGAEIDCRSWPVHPKRRTRLRIEYCLAAIRARGRPDEKFRLLLAAAGLRPFNRGRATA